MMRVYAYLGDTWRVLRYMYIAVSPIWDDISVHVCMYLLGKVLQRAAKFVSVFSFKEMTNCKIF